MDLSSLIAPYSSVSIMGMCKNAGKTTVLCSLIAAQPQLAWGLTSIGRDGEEKDLVTGTPKPGIYLYRGALFATAEGMLRQCDATLEILDVTPFSTPLGDVIVARALSDGYVQLAGPSMSAQLTRLMDQFEYHGAQKIIVDGALSRKSLASPAVTQSAILAVGASYSRDIQRTVEDGAFVAELFSLPLTSANNAAQLSEQRGERLIRQEGLWHPFEQPADLRKYPRADLVYVGGAVTEQLAVSLAHLGRSLTLLCRDPSRLLFSPAALNKLAVRDIRLEVVNSCKLVAITVNPFSAYGYHYDKGEFKLRMERAVSLPVFDTEEDA